MAGRQSGRGGTDVAQERRRVGTVAYEEAGPQYFAKRLLKRHAAFWSLWSLGVAAVISGDFYGWNLGLSAGGFGGLLIATIFIAAMYYGLCFSIAEMSPALPHTGGAYSFARSAIGPWGGFITGLAENMEYVITPAVVVGAMGFLMHDITKALLNLTSEPWWNSPVTWFIVSYIVFVGINIIGIVATMRFTVLINIVALGILAFFFISVLVSGKMDLSLLFNIKPDAGQSSFLPHRLAGIFPAIPFAIWFYLAIEELPLAAEETHDSKLDIPRATLGGLTTLRFTRALTFALHPAVGGAACGADRRWPGGPRACDRDVLPGTGRWLAGGSDRRRASLHGGVRRGHFLCDAVPVVHHAQAPAAEYRTTLPQPGWRVGRRDRGCDRAGRIGLPLFE